MKGLDLGVGNRGTEYDDWNAMGESSSDDGVERERSIWCKYYSHTFLLDGSFHKHYLLLTIITASWTIPIYGDMIPSGSFREACVLSYTIRLGSTTRNRTDDAVMCVDLAART